MKTKRSHAGLIIGGIVVFIFIALLVVGLIIIVQKGDLFDNPDEVMETPMKLYLKTIDDVTKEEVDSNYSVYTNNVLISEGFMSSLTEIETPRTPIEVYCWNDNHYLRKGIKIYEKKELIANQSQFNCPMRRIGDLSITHTGNLINRENVIKFNITVKDDWWQKLSIAIAWSPGIINVYQRGGEEIMCDRGEWKNYTDFNASSNLYTWTPKHYYVCGTCQNGECEKSEKCISVEKNKCEPFSTLVPNRFLGKVDKVQYFAKNLHNESYEVTFHIKTLENKNSLDFVEFIFYDKEKRFDPQENLWRYMSEKDGINLGGEDFRYRIDYLR